MLRKCIFQLQKKKFTIEIINSKVKKSDLQKILMPPSNHLCNRARWKVEVIQYHSLLRLNRCHRGFRVELNYQDIDPELDKIPAIIENATEYS